MIEYDPEAERHGWSRFAAEHEVRQSGLTGGRGLFLGYWQNWRLSRDNDAPGAVFAPSGSGKGRDWLVETILRGGRYPMVIFDPKGELAAITIASFVRWNVWVYLWNPRRLHGLPHNRLQPLDILTLDNPDFHADCTHIANEMVPIVGSSNHGHFFERRARAYLEALMKSLVEQHGHVSLPMLWSTVRGIDGNGERCDVQLTAMDNSSFQDVRDTAIDMWERKRKEHSNEFGSIISTIKAHLSFLNDPVLADSLENPDFSLRDLTGEQVVSMFAMIPRDFLAQTAAVFRLMFLVMSKYKQRAPQARRITMLVDEAGQMGHFQSLLDAFNIGRGEGIRAIPLFQSLAQIERNFGRHGIQEFLGSANWRCFYKPQDLATAEMLSHMLGNQTLQYDDVLAQKEALRQQWEAAHRGLSGEGGGDAAYDFIHFGAASRSRSKIQRPLMTPSELLNMPDDKAIHFMAGLNIPPLYADKRPYWESRDLNGLWLPNPLHPPVDAVPLRGMFGSRWHRVVRQDAVPDHLRHFPQHQNGIAFVEGHRPW